MAETANKSVIELSLDSTCNGMITKSAVVRVRFGTHVPLPEERLLAYFEDKRLSDGGPVEAISEPGDGTYVLTFMNPEDAGRVVYKNHNFDGVDMNVAPFVPERTHSIKNSNEDTKVKLPFTSQMTASGLYDDIANTASMTDDGDNNDEDNSDDKSDNTQEIDVVAARLRYLQKHHRRELEDISKGVNMKLDKQNWRVVIRGRKETLDSAVKAINGLLHNIEQESFTISRTRVLDFLKSKLGQEKLARIEEVTQTTMDIGEGLYAFIGGEQNISINVIQGDIAIQQADVLVDTVPPSLKLSEGVLSGHMLRAGGEELQTQCNNMYPNGIKYGDVVKTAGGQLQCKQIYHCCIQKWKGSNFKDLEDILFLCLNDAASSGYRSITFPALGTGHLGYPAEKVARLMVTEIIPLLDRLECLKTVSVVLDPSDADIIRFFNAELKKRGDDQIYDKVKVTENEIGIGEMTVKIKQGDITAENTDAIVNSTDSNLTLTKGTLSRAISEACGGDIHDQCKLKVAEMKKHGIVVTTAPRIPARWIIHASFEHFHGNIKEIVKECLKTAQHHEMTSVSFPPLGTGYGSVPVERMCKVLITVLRKYGGRKSTLRDIRVVIYEKEKHRFFLDKLREIVAKIENEKSWKRVVSRKSKITRKSLDRNSPPETKSHSEDASHPERQVGDKSDYLILCNADAKTEEAEVNIYSPSLENRKRAFEEIQKLCDDHIIEKSFRNMNIAKFSSLQMQQLKRFLADMNMKITVYPETGKVEVEGFRDTVTGFESHLSDMVDVILSQASP